MRTAPFSLECLGLFIGELIGLEFTPGVEAAHVAKRQITRLADGTLGAVLRVCAWRLTEDPASCGAVRLITRVAGGVEAPIGVELPLLTGNPRQRAALD